MPPERSRPAEAAPGGGLRQDAQRNRARLVAAAELAFAEHGLDPSMDDIARAAGVAPATLYRRFPNKDALVAAVLVSYFDRLIALAQAALAEPPERCLDTYLLTVAHELAASRGLTHGDWAHIAPARPVAELRSLTATLLQKAQDGGGISKHLTVGDIAAAIWALRGIIQTSDHVAPDAWRRHAAFLLAGYRSDAAPTGDAITIDEIDAAVKGARKT
jgi:AcrR family transcriptional regulator